MQIRLDLCEFCSWDELFIMYDANESLVSCGEPPLQPVQDLSNIAFTFKWQLFEYGLWAVWGHLTPKT